MGIILVMGIGSYFLYNQYESVKAENVALTFAVEEQKKTIEVIKENFERQGKALNNLTARNAEIEGEMGDSQMGLQARLMSKALRKLTGSINKANCCCIFINQLREKIGVMFGNPETTTGGNALKFYASVRVDIRRSSQIKEGDEILGNRTRVKVVKNKVAPPFRKAEFDIMYGGGISKVGEILDLGVDMNIVKKSGSWFSYGETRLGQGRDAVKAIIKDNPELMEEIEQKIKEALAPKGEVDLVEQD